jgi:hypothetical protein
VLCTRNEMGDLENKVACGRKMLNGVLERKGATYVEKKQNQEGLTLIHVELNSTFLNTYKVTSSEKGCTSTLVLLSIRTHWYRTLYVKNGTSLCT